MEPLSRGAGRREAWASGLLWRSSNLVTKSCYDKIQDRILSLFLISICDSSHPWVVQRHTCLPPTSQTMAPRPQSRGSL